MEAWAKESTFWNVKGEYDRLLLGQLHVRIVHCCMGSLAPPRMELSRNGEYKSKACSFSSLRQKSDVSPPTGDRKCLHLKLRHRRLKRAYALSIAAVTNDHKLNALK